MASSLATAFDALPSAEDVSTFAAAKEELMYAHLQQVLAAVATAIKTGKDFGTDDRDTSNVTVTYDDTFHHLEVTTMVDVAASMRHLYGAYKNEIDAAFQRSNLEIVGVNKEGHGFWGPNFELTLTYHARKPAM